MKHPVAPEPAAARRRRRQRGAALVQGLAVAAGSIALLALGLALHERQSARLEQAREARLAVWQLARAGCRAPAAVSTLARAALEGRLAAEARRLVERAPVAGGGRGGRDSRDSRDSRDNRSLDRQQHRRRAAAAIQPSLDLYDEVQRVA